mmetsp:Transcript_18463/g.30608  ORF Transcript_18463/g.30608 Transcript_18463/m.30608 type:complete len:237 (-) Transcript_18463:644-1354(-)
MFLRLGIFGENRCNGRLASLIRICCFEHFIESCIALFVIIRFVVLRQEGLVVWSRMTDANVQLSLGVLFPLDWQVQTFPKRLIHGTWIHHGVTKAFVLTNGIIFHDIQVQSIALEQILRRNLEQEQGLRFESPNRVESFWNVFGPVHFSVIKVTHHIGVRRRQVTSRQVSGTDNFHQQRDTLQRIDFNATRISRKLLRQSLILLGLLRFDKVDAILRVLFCIEINFARLLNRSIVE